MVTLALVSSPWPASPMPAVGLAVLACLRLNKDGKGELDCDFCGVGCFVCVCGLFFLYFSVCFRVRVVVCVFFVIFVSFFL